MWGIENLVNRTEPNQHATLHYREPTRDARRDPQVTRNNQRRKISFTLKVAQGVKYALTHAHIDATGWLVGDEQRRLQDKSPGKRNTLALAAAELPRHPIHHTERKAHRVDEAGHGI